MKAVSNIKSRIAKALPYLAWVSFAFALLGGTLLPGTVLGRTIADIIGSIPWGWVAPVAFAVMIVGIVIDIGRDLLPNRIAVYGAALAPTVASAVTGKLADKVTDLGDWMASWMSTPLRDWTGITDTTGQAIVALGLAYVVAKRVVKDGKASKGRAMYQDVSV